MLLFAASAAAQAAFIPTYLRDAQGAKIAGTNVWKSGLIFGKGRLGIQHAYHNVIKGNMAFAVAGAGFSMATAPKHRAIASAARSLSSLPVEALGYVFGGAAGAVAAGSLSDMTIGRGVEAAVGAMTDLGLARGKLHMGGDYSDSQAAYTMRQVAVQQMSTSSLNARRWLGQEGALMHT